MTTCNHITFDKWSLLPDGTAVLANNAPYIPCPVSQEEVPFPRADGSWGPHETSLVPQIFDPEHPYLAHIVIDQHHCFRLPQSIVCHRFKESDFYRFPTLPRRGRTKKTILSDWLREVDSYKDCVFRLYDELQSTFPGSYKSPTIALARIEQTIFMLEENIMSYRDAVEYTAGLQRFVKEIQAFLVWGSELLGRTLMERKPLRACFRGSYVSSLSDFNRLSARGIPVFYLTGSSPSGLPSSRYVRLTDLKSICEFRTWADVHAIGCNRDIVKGNLVHSKPLMFYPPHVDPLDPLAFERAARGYASRLDKQRFDHRLITDSISLFNPPPRGSLPRKPKPQHSDWRRQTKDLHKDWPAWGCDWDYLWHYHARGDGLPEYTTPDSPIPSHGANFRYTIPPVHLLSNVQSDEKRAKVFFTWVCIRRIWLLRYENYRLVHPSRVVATTTSSAAPTPFHLYTQTWRDILSGQWWRKSSGTSGYDHRFFWRHGGQPILGPSQEDLDREQEDSIDACYSQSDDLSPCLASERRLELKDFENKDLCNLVVYDLALLNHKLQFEETDDFVMHIDSMSLQDRHARLKARGDLFRSSWDIPKDAFAWHDTKWESSTKWTLAIPWYTRFRSLLATWPREYDLENIDWQKDLSGMTQWPFTEYSRTLVVFYRRVVMHVLGIAVAPLLRYPNTDGVDLIFLSM